MYLIRHRTERSRKVRKGEGREGSSGQRKRARVVDRGMENGAGNLQQAGRIWKVQNSLRCPIEKGGMGWRRKDFPIIKKAPIREEGTFHYKTSGVTVWSGRNLKGRGFGEKGKRGPLGSAKKLERGEKQYTYRWPVSVNRREIKSKGGGEDGG